MLLGQNYFPTTDKKMDLQVITIVGLKNAKDVITTAFQEEANFRSFSFNGFLEATYHSVSMPFPGLNTDHAL